MVAEIDVINESWNADSSSNNVADSVGLMVYEGTQVDSRGAHRQPINIKKMKRGFRDTIHDIVRDRKSEKHELILLLSRNHRYILGDEYVNCCFVLLQALQYVKNFANGSGQWQGFPIKVIPKNYRRYGHEGRR